MTCDELRQRAAWLEAGAIRFAGSRVAALLQSYADEARGKADGMEARRALELRDHPDPVASDRATRSID